MVGKLEIVLDKEKSDRVAEVARVELSGAHDVVHRAVLMIQRLSCGLSIPLTTSDHKVARIAFKLGDFVSCCENNTRSNERGSGLEDEDLLLLLLLLLAVALSLF